MSEDVTNDARAAWRLDPRYSFRVLETPESLVAVEDLQRLVWPGNETEIVPMHMLLTAAHNGGLLVGAFDLGGSASNGQDEPPDAGSKTGGLPDGPLVGFVFGFPGLYFTPDGPRIKHCSHMLGVHPDYRDQGLGFTLKRAQWQMVRHQGVDRITWTYDPLLSRNAHLNIARLGTVCNTYLREAYGEMRDDLNVGLPSDRFQVDWWVNSQRVFRRLGKRPRRPLDLANFLSAGATILNPTTLGPDGLPLPAAQVDASVIEVGPDAQGNPPILLLEIPADFMALKAASHNLALEWRLHTRALFEALFGHGYLVTDFVYLPGSFPRSFYVLSHENASVDGIIRK